MLQIRLPDGGVKHLEHLVLDFNGTLACDGVLLDGVRERMDRLSKYLSIHVVTGDSFGKAREQSAGAPCELTILASQGQAAAKRAYVDRLGAATTVCIGNGNNDRLMLQRAALAIAVVQREGAAVAALRAADIVVGNVVDALDLLANPVRLIATLRG